MILKITNGYVVQRYNNDGLCVGQQFCSSNEKVTYETEDGYELNMPFDGNEYFPFEMVQPESDPHIVHF